MEYKDTTGKLSYVQERVSINPTNENKEYKINNDNIYFRLTEGDLHRIIKESVNRILKENETHIDKSRKKAAEEKASWDAWENTSPYQKSDNLPTELDDKLFYDLILKVL